MVDEALVRSESRVYVLGTVPVDRILGDGDLSCQLSIYSEILIADDAPDLDTLDVGRVPAVDIGRVGSPHQVLRFLLLDACW